MAISGYIWCHNNIYLTRKGIEAFHWKMASFLGVIQKLLQSMKVMEHQKENTLMNMVIGKQGPRYIWLTDMGKMDMHPFMMRTA